LAARRVTYGPYRPPHDGPYRRAKNDPAQMRRPAQCAYYNSDISLQSMYNNLELSGIYIIPECEL